MRRKGYKCESGGAALQDTEEVELQMYLEQELDAKILYLATEKSGITPLNPGLDEKLCKYSQGSTRHGTHGAHIIDTEDLAKTEWHKWPVTRSRPDVRSRVPPVTG